MWIYKKAILPEGFLANGVACGIKRNKLLDLALFYSDRPAVASCRFTSNKITAAPIQVSRDHLKKSREFRAIIINSGNANCFTQEAGVKDASRTTQVLAGVLGVKKEGVLVASTGIIGRRLRLDKITDAIPGLVKGMSKKGTDKAKRAIMTTDTFSKEITVKFNAGGKIITICGVAKGAGMISPDMATMLAFILTDAGITRGALDRALGICLGSSFNCITVDGCMSTNDSLMALANGSVKNSLIMEKGRNFDLFTKALGVVCLELAKMIVRDAEGAKKFIQIAVDGAIDFKAARKTALSIANSNLFKTAMYGEDPNFGRIVAAVGASKVALKEKDIRIRVSPLDKREIKVSVHIGRGRGSATVYTCDLTPEYIKINAAYN